MNAGLMDRKIIIEQPTIAASAYGKHGATTWATYTTQWARVDLTGGSESIGVDQKEARQSATFTIHYKTGITNKMRISYNGSYWNINSFQEINRRQYLRMEAEKVD